MAELKPKRKGNWRHTGNPVHGLFKGNENLFNLWQTIKNRCENPNRPNYKNYGGRGIKLCAEWQKAENFVRWALANGYDKTADRGATTIDRIDNDKGYSPENCRWATKSQQARNKSSNAIYATSKGTGCQAELAKIWGIDEKLVSNRIHRGWSAEAAFSTPPRQGNYRRKTRG